MQHEEGARAGSADEVGVRENEVNYLDAASTVQHHERPWNKMNQPHANRAEAKEFLRWRYGDQPAQVVYGDDWKAEEVAPDGIDALLDRVGDRRFYFAPCALRPAWSGTSPKPEDVVESSFVWFDFDAAKFGDDADTAPSDGPNMIPLDQLDALIERAVGVWEAARA